MLAAILSVLHTLSMKRTGLIWKADTTKSGALYHKVTTGGLGLSPCKNNEKSYIF
jgi:hypothetical protein